jgi:glutathione synthase
MRYVYVMDPMEKVLPDKDTTFAFQRAAQSRGYHNFHAEPRDVYVREGKVFARVRPLQLAKEAPFATLGTSQELALADVDCVFIRKDPPFDSSYLYLTLQLELLRGKTLVMNDPRGLREANEKLYTLNFLEWMPTTLVSALSETIFEFVDSLGGVSVIKPLDGAGGSGVMLLRKDDKNARAIVEAVTGEGRRLAMVQAYVPDVTKGDKRILLLDGEPLGAINRVPRSDDLRSNIHVGGRVEPCEITEQELTMIRSLAPRLKRDGLFFVGLDVIGGKLTEVNVTSPTGIQELSQHRGEDIALKVVDWAATHAVKKAT